MNSIEEQVLNEKVLFLMSFMRLRRIAPQGVNCQAAAFLPILTQDVASFLEGPDTSAFRLSWVLSLLDIYSDTQPFEVAHTFFSSLDLAQLSRIVRHQKISVVSRYLQTMVKYLKRPELPVAGIPSLVEVTLLTIDVDECAQKINDELRCKAEKYLVVAAEGDFEHNTLSSTLYSLANSLVALSGVLNRIFPTTSIEECITRIYSQVDFAILGRLMEKEGKGVGPVSSTCREISRVHARTSQLISFLSQIDFERLAKSYNSGTMGNTAFADFLKIYTSSKELRAQWKLFYRSVDFRYGTGFNFADCTMILQAMLQCLSDEPELLRSLLGKFDFVDVAEKARGKRDKSIGQLLKHMNRLPLLFGQSMSFFTTLGTTEWTRLLNSKESLPDAKAFLRRKCKISEDEILRLEWE